MLVAVLAVLATALVLVSLIVVVFYILRRRKSESIGLKKDVRSVSSVGTSSTLPDTAKRTVHTGISQKGTVQQSAKGPVDSLRSRFMAIGVLAAAVFSVLSARLFTLQILEQEEFQEESDLNQYTTVYTPAPRGRILDADGLPLVDNRTSLTVLADAEVADDQDIVKRLSVTLGVPHNVVRSRIQDESDGAQAQRIVASDVTIREAAFIAEHSDAFPGVVVDERAIRSYPYGALAAHALGYTGSVSTDDLENSTNGRQLKLGDDVGRSGVESTYDNLLAGDHGVRTVVVNTYGSVIETVSETQPVEGSDVYVTIKGPVQYVCDRVLAETVAPEGIIGEGVATAAAIVVMDVRDGGIVAMSSYPTYTPESFIGGIPQEIWEIYNTEESYLPMLNRTITGTYPAASTYKSFTGLAALAYGFADEERTWNCTGSWDGWNSGTIQKCWLRTGHGQIGFQSGLTQSCDIVYYDIGYNFFEQMSTVGESAMQDYIMKYRFGELTGIDLVGEESGVVPTPQWKADYFRNYPEEAVWKGGDSTNMAIGQGYVLTTPIQLAVAYGAIATGQIVKPHLLKEVHNVAGEVALQFKPEVIAEPDVSADHLKTITEALQGVAINTSAIADVFSQNGIDPNTICSKTGTAEVANKEDYALYVCYGPADDPRYVAVCVLEEGLAGGEVAGPVGAQALSAALNYDAGLLTEMGFISGSTGESVPRAL